MIRTCVTEETWISVLVANGGRAAFRSLCSRLGLAEYLLLDYCVLRLAARAIFSPMSAILWSLRRFSLSQYGLVISLKAWIAAWIPSAQATAISLMSPCTSPTAKIPRRLLSKYGSMAMLPLSLMV